jgi:hypothetical protein
MMFTGSQKIETRIGTLEFTHGFANGYPTDATIEKLYDERDFQRACQERTDRRNPVARSQTRHPDRQCNDTVLPRVRRSLRRTAGHGDPAARRARRDQRRLATNYSRH